MQKTPVKNTYTSPSPGKVVRHADLCIQSNCNHSRHENSPYCLRHILQDPTAPYKQCAYIYNSTGKRCLNIAPKLEKKDG